MRSFGLLGPLQGKRGQRLHLPKEHLTNKTSNTFLHWSGPSPSHSRYGCLQYVSKADTLTNKKGDKTGDKTGDKGRQKGDKVDTLTSKKGDKTGDKGRQKGDKTDTMTNKKGDKKGDKDNRRETRRTQ